MNVFSAKKVLRTLAALMVIFAISHSALGSGEIGLIPVKENSKAVVSLDDLDQSQTILSIVDEKQNYVYYESRIDNAGSFRKVFDLSNLEDGSYYLTAKTRSGILKKKFRIEHSQIIIDDDTRIAPPKIFENGDFLTLMFENPLKSRIKVCFSDDNDIFFNDYSTGSEIARKYDLRKLPEGSYEVVLTSGDYFYTYDLMIEK